MVSEQRIAEYYDRLTRWTQATQTFRRMSPGLSVHRPLADPGSLGRTTTARLHDLLTDHLPPLDEPRVLDAGCGLGGTILHLAPRLGGTYVGLTLSPVQASVATEALSKGGLGGMAEVIVGSFDTPPRGPFDLVLLIESLAHSSDPEHTLAALRAVLAPRGLLVIVDDMPERSAVDSAELERFKACWSCPMLLTHDRCRPALTGLGASIVVDRDLTADCRPRTVRTIQWLEWVNRTLWRAIPLAGWRGVMDSHYGGLALERLYRTGRIRYRLVVARWP